MYWAAVTRSPAARNSIACSVSSSRRYPCSSASDQRASAVAIAALTSTDERRPGSVYSTYAGAGRPGDGGAEGVADVGVERREAEVLGDHHAQAPRLRRRGVEPAGVDAVPVARVCADDAAQHQPRDGHRARQRAVGHA
jgi:hypothetical protein